MAESAKEMTGYQGRDDWFQTWSGKTLLILEPDFNQICIEDIAHALARQCRYNGHVNTAHYSVAQHSVLASIMVPPEAALEGLLHDAAEAYLGDCIRPLKNQLSNYRELEDMWDLAIGTAFGLKYGHGGKTLVVVKQADLTLLATELRDLWLPGSRHPRWNNKAESDAEPMKDRIIPWDAALSESVFLDRFNDLYPR